MNREQRRAQARRKPQGMSYAGQLARRKIQYQHEAERAAWEQMQKGAADG